MRILDSVETQNLCAYENIAVLTLPVGVVIPINTQVFKIYMKNIDDDFVVLGVPSRISFKNIQKKVLKLSSVPLNTALNFLCATVKVRGKGTSFL